MLVRPSSMTRDTTTAVTPVPGWQEDEDLMNDPVTMRRQLRAELKRLRAERDLTQRHVAEQLDWSPSKIIRIEKGVVAIGVTDLQALLRLYDVQDKATIDALVAMARGSKRLPFNEYPTSLRPRRCAISDTSRPPPFSGSSSRSSFLACCRRRSTLAHSSRTWAILRNESRRSGPCVPSVRRYWTATVRQKCSSFLMRPRSGGSSGART